MVIRSIPSGRDPETWAMELVQETLKLLTTSQRHHVLRRVIEEVLPSKELIQRLDEREPEWDEIAAVIGTHRIVPRWDEWFEGAVYDHKDCRCDAQIRPVVGFEPFEQHVAEAVFKALRREAAS